MSKILQDISIGGNLQRLRKAKGYTQRQVCAALELLGRPMRQSTYAQIETGARNIFVSDLIALKRILGFSYDDIFKDLEPKSKYEEESEVES